MNACQLVPVANRYRLEPQPHSSSSPSTQSCVPPFSEHHPTTGCYTNVRQEISLFPEINGLLPMLHVSTNNVLFSSRWRPFCLPAAC